MSAHVRAQINVWAKMAIEGDGSANDDTERQEGQRATKFGAAQDQRGREGERERAQAQEEAQGEGRGRGAGGTERGAQQGGEPRKAATNGIRT